MSLITFQGQQFSIPQEAYGLTVCRGDPALRFHQKYLNLCSEDERVNTEKMSNPLKLIFL